ncbi:tbc domain-containing kinase (incomplete catalytic triad) [Cystoisospora suis]|uniref:Tbc domain-containing kinase (Incomplete catalytic triad) n=1 Tax=Cystoisospora suis TaxID=483139 RepID=A0A2C6LFQ7_9APIC|nr:tbc domain-containing kinase (incomplete catalytic triad) [Cystoisospora suis]
MGLGEKLPVNHHHHPHAIDMTRQHEFTSFCPVEDQYVPPQSQFLLGFQTFSVSESSPRIYSAFHSSGESSVKPWIDGLSRYLPSPPVDPPTHTCERSCKGSSGDHHISPSETSKRLIISSSSEAPTSSNTEIEDKETEPNDLLFLPNGIERNQPDKSSSSDHKVDGSSDLIQKRDEEEHDSLDEKTSPPLTSNRSSDESSSPSLEETREEEPAYRQVVSRFQELKRLRHPHLCAYTHILRKADRFFVVAEHWSLSLADIVHQRESQQTLSRHHLLSGPTLDQVDPSFDTRADNEHLRCQENLSTRGTAEGLHQAGTSSQRFHRHSFFSSTSSCAPVSSEAGGLSSTSSSNSCRSSSPSTASTGPPVSTPNLSRASPHLQFSSASSSSSLSHIIPSVPHVSSIPPSRSSPPTTASISSRISTPPVTQPSASLSLLLPESFLRRVAREILSALIFLNENGLVHLRLCPSTVLFDASGHVRLAEWGLSHLTNQGFLSPYTSLYPSPPFLTPQQGLVGPDILSVSSPCSKHDTWALGAILLYAIQGPCRISPRELHTSLTAASRGYEDDLSERWTRRLIDSDKQSSATQEINKETLALHGIEERDEGRRSGRDNVFSGRDLKDQEEGRKRYLLLNDLECCSTATGASEMLRGQDRNSSYVTSPSEECKQGGGDPLSLKSEENNSLLRDEEVKERNSALSVLLEAENCVWDDWRGCEGMFTKGESDRNVSEGFLLPGFSFHPERAEGIGGREAKVLPRTHALRTLREVERLALMLLYIHWAYEAHNETAVVRVGEKGAVDSRQSSRRIPINFTCIGRGLERRLRQKKTLLLKQMKFLIKSTCCFVEPAAYEALLALLTSDPGLQTRHTQDPRNGGGEYDLVCSSQHRSALDAGSSEGSIKTNQLEPVQTSLEYLEDALLWAILSFHVSWFSASRCPRAHSSVKGLAKSFGNPPLASIDSCQTVHGDSQSHSSSRPVVSSDDTNVRRSIETRRHAEEENVKNAEILSASSSSSSSSCRTSLSSSEVGSCPSSSNASSSSSLPSRFSSYLLQSSGLPKLPRGEIHPPSRVGHPHSRGLSHPLLIFLERCLCVNPETRPSPAEARGLAWFYDANEKVENRSVALSPLRTRGDPSACASDILLPKREERKRVGPSLSEGSPVGLRDEKEEEQREERQHNQKFPKESGVGACLEGGDMLWCPRSAAQAAKILLELEADADTLQGKKTTGASASASSLNFKDFLFRYHNVPLDEVFFWWQLKGGDVHAALAERGAFRPVPPILRLPLCCLLRSASSSPSSLCQREISALSSSTHEGGLVHVDSIARGSQSRERPSRSTSASLNTEARKGGANSGGGGAGRPIVSGVHTPELSQQQPEDLERVPLLSPLLDLRQLHSITDAHRCTTDSDPSESSPTAVCTCQKLQARGCQILESCAHQHPIKKNTHGRSCEGLREERSHSPYSPKERDRRSREGPDLSSSDSSYRQNRETSPSLSSLGNRNEVYDRPASPLRIPPGCQRAVELSLKEKGRDSFGGSPPSVPEGMNGSQDRDLIEGSTRKEEEELQGRILKGIGVVSECSFFATGFGKGRSWRDVDSPWIEGDARTRGVSIEDTVTAIQEADRFPISQMHEVRPRCLYTRQFHFLYQRLRVRLFRSLLAQLPKSRSRLTEEASVDIPPLLRPQIWATLLGVNFTAEVVAGPFLFDQLVIESLFIREAQQLRINEFSQCHEYHDLLGSRFGRRQLRRLLQALLAQAHSTVLTSSLNGGVSPSVSTPETSSSSIFASVRGLDAIAAPFQLLYVDHPQVALACLHQVLVQRGHHQLFGPDNVTAIHEQLACFSQLLHFVDPLLAIHLKRIGLHPDMYALSWILTLFSHALELQQLYLLWDSLLFQPPSFTLFVAVSLLHHLRCPLLQLAPDEESSALALLRAATAFLHIPSLCAAAVALQDATPVSVSIPFVARKLSHYHDSDRSRGGTGLSNSSGHHQLASKTSEEKRQGEEKIEVETESGDKGEENKKGPRMAKKETHRHNDLGSAEDDEEEDDDHDRESLEEGEGHTTKNFYIGDDDGDDEPSRPDSSLPPSLLQRPQRGKSSQEQEKGTRTRGSQDKEDKKKKKKGKSFMASMMQGPALMLMGPPRKANRPLFQEDHSDGTEEEERRISDPLQALMDEDEEADRWWETTGSNLYSSFVFMTEGQALSTSRSTRPPPQAGVLSNMLARGDSSPPLLTVDDLLEHRESSTVLDVRTPDAFATVHFDGSKNVASDTSSAILTSVLSAAAKAAASTAAYFPDSFPESSCIITHENESSGESLEKGFSERSLHAAPSLSSSSSRGGGGISGVSTPFSSRLLSSGRQLLLPSSASASSTASTVSSIDSSSHSPGEISGDVKGSAATVARNAVVGSSASQNPLSHCDGAGEAQYSQKSQSVAPWIRSGMSHKLHLVVVTGNRADPGFELATRLQRAGVLHVCVLLGGIDAIVADAPTCFLVRG